MRRSALLMTLCVALLGGSLLGANAQQYAIAGRTNANNELIMDVSLRDADLGETLAALFNTTNNKYAVRLEPGVVGRIGRLQLTQTPFDQVLDAILGNEYSYAKQQQPDGTYLYRISGQRSGATAAPRTNPAPNFAPPADIVSTRTPSTTASPTSDANTEVSASRLLSILSNTFSGSNSGDPSAKESSVVALIPVYNLDLANLCENLGGDVVDLFPQGQGIGTGGGGNRNYGGTGRTNNSYNRGTNYNNNTNYNNLNNNRTYNNTNTNRVNRTTN